MARTFLATLHYDGTGFAGWQRQAVGRTVQQELEGVLGRLANGQVRAHAAGRTDAGVHALGMAVSFAMPDRWAASPLKQAMNALLPSDCYVAAVQEARAGFHARKCADLRRYEYRIGTDPGAASPFRARFEWALMKPLDLDRLQTISGPLAGEHDFFAFAVQGHLKPHTRCSITTLRWEPRDDHPGVRLVIAANRFLHHMVRMVTATVVDIALDRRPDTDLPRLLAREPGVRSSAPAPAHGLYFHTATYPDAWFPRAEATP